MNYVALGMLLNLSEPYKMSKMTIWSGTDTLPIQKQIMHVSIIYIYIYIYIYTHIYMYHM